MRSEKVALLLLIPAILTVIVVWFRIPAGWLDVFRMIVMTGALVLLALVMAAVWPR
jgi:hypothetical protein